MPIKTLNRSLPVMGKIRLGVRKKSQSGNDYPSETEYFVLDEVPEVKAIYGEKPQAIDVFFPSDDLDLVAPYWYKWYAAGVKGKDGSIIGGKLQCKGDGEVADWFAHRDPTTREVPQRTCKGPECPDWSRNGIQQCKPSMSLYIILPLVSHLGIYQIDTTSWNSIRIIISQLETIKRTQGRLINIPFQLFREETATSYVDKEGKEQRRAHFIMKIKPNEQFLLEHGGAIREKAALLAAPVWQPDEQKLIEAPMEDHWEVSGSQVAITDSNGEVTEVVSKADLIKEVAEDPEIAPLFTDLCKAKGVTNNEQRRVLTARKFEDHDDPKTALKDYLEKQLAATAKALGDDSNEEATKKTAKKASKKASAPPAEATPPPQEVDTEGLI